MANYSSEEYQQIIDEYNAAIAAHRPISDDLAQRIRAAQRSITQYAGDTNAGNRTLKDSAVKLGSDLMAGREGLSAYNEVTAKGLTDLGNYLETTGKFGKGAKAAADAAAFAIPLINQQADGLFDAFRDISRSGLAVGMDDTFKNLQKSGYTVAQISEYGNLLKQNAETLARFGGTAADGAKNFSDVSNAITNSELETEFMNMGLTQTDINSGIANYIKRQQLSGSSRTQSLQELKESASAFIDEQDRLTRLTGMNSKKQNELMEHELAQQEYSAHVYELKQKMNKGGAEGQAAKEQLEKEQAAFVNASANGNQKIADGLALAFSGSVSDQAQAYKRAFSTTIKTIKDPTKKIADVFAAQGQDARETMDKISTTVGKYGGKAGETFGDIPGMVKLASTNKQDAQENYEKAVNQASAAKAGADQGVKNQVEIRENQRDTTQTLDLLLNQGIVPIATGFANLSDAAQQLVSMSNPVLGKGGQVGGGTSLPEKIGRALGFSGGTAGAAGSAGGATRSLGGGPGGSSGGGAGAGNFFNNLMSGGGAAAGASAASPGILEKILATIRQRESGGNYQIKAKGSSASGAYQFIDSTWQSLVKKYNVGKEFLSANLAPPEIQDQVARKYVEEILAKNNGDITAVPKTWYTGNAQGKMSASALAANKGMTADMYSQKWLGDLNKNGGTAVAGNAPEIGKKLSGPSSGYNSTLANTKPVVPLPDGNKIPVQYAKNEQPDENDNLMNMKIQKLDLLISSLQKQVGTSEKILQQQA